ncbi:hypothetical protein ACHAXT_013358 [Thalassiosira profunda]
MKSIAACFLCLALLFDGTASYLATPPLPPHPRMTPTRAHRRSPVFPSSVAHLRTGAPLRMADGGRPGVFRRARNRLQTLIRPKTSTQKEKEPEQMWKVMFHDTEYLPGYVCKALAKAMPMSKKVAYEICLRAREEKVVPLTVCNKKQAEKYCGAILRQGLTATIEPLEFE